jgi:hypothetical protein
VQVADLLGIQNIKAKKVSFGGYSTDKDAKGEKTYKFNYPADYSKYNVYLEVFSVKKKNGYENKFDIDSTLKTSNGLDKVKIEKGGTELNLTRMYGLPAKAPFAYCYRIEPKDGGEAKRAVDPGDLINYSTESKFDKFNIVYQNGSRTNKGGSMLLLIPDTYRPGFVIEDSSKSDDEAVVVNKDIENRAINSHRNFANKVGGTIGGIINKIPELAQTGYTRIVSLPLFTDDSLSSHGYWNKNAMQIVQSAGNLNDYAMLQRKMYKNNMNLVADGAFVNEGLEGIHFKDVLKWGEDSPFYGWFRAENLKNSPLSMGVFSKNHEFIRHRLVNSPYSYKTQENGKIVPEKNSNYDPNKPTYIQIYDKRMVSADQLQDSSKLIKFYDKTNTNDLFEINTHNDTVINYAFEINPETYKKNISDLNEYNKVNNKNINLNSSDAAMFLTKGDNYSLTEKYESGVETWDANSDITKLNYLLSKSDINALSKLPESERDLQLKKLARNNYQVQDYAIASGRYWTQKTKNIINEYTARTLKDLNGNPYQIKHVIDEAIANNELPSSLEGKINRNIINNVLNGEYKLSINNKSRDYNDNVLSGIMNLPLDSIEFGDSISSVLAYPYITNRATSRETLGKSRFALYKDGNPQLTNKYRAVYDKTTKMYTNTMKKFADDIFNQVNEKQPDENKLFENGTATELGQYVLPMFGQDVAKFAVIKALYPKATYKIKQNGEIVYDYKKLKDLQLGDIGVDGNSPEAIASNLVSKINSGLNNISEQDKAALKSSLEKRLDGVSANSYKMAEVLTDKASAGLDWRIDATKDIADMDSIRNHHSDFDGVWKDLTGFWDKFTSSVLKTNPNSYIAAEVTQTYDIHENSNIKTGGHSIKADKAYENGNEAGDTLVAQTGMTTTANYSTFFTDVIKLFGKNFEDASFDNDYKVHDQKIYDKLAGAYLASTQLKSLLYSYTFIGNHDKPRALHCLALDMTTFHTDFSRTDNVEMKRNAISILKNIPLEQVSASDIKNFRFNTVSGKAIAMGGCLKGRIGEAIDSKYGLDDKRGKELKDELGQAIAKLASGKFKDHHFAPDAFGTKPFDEVIDAVLQEMDYLSPEKAKMSDADKAAIFNKTFENTIKPAMTRLKGMMSFLVSLPGNPTLFAGDELGLTGYDEKCKNVYLQSRGCLHWEWLSGANKQFFLDNQKSINDIMSIRGRKELQPLNDGTPYVLGLQEAGNKSNHVSGILRQSPNGAMVISLFNATGVGDDYWNEAKPEAMSLDKINLNISRKKLNQLDDGLRFGLPDGTKFYNADNPKDEYVVCENGQSIKKLGKKVNGKDPQIEIADRNLILYSEPETAEHKSKPSFSGRKVLYNPQFNFVSSPYTQKKLAEMGQNLQLMSK